MPALSPARRRALLACLAATVARPPAPAAAAAPERLVLRGDDDRGLPFGLQDLQGRWAVLTLAYGACRRICSTSLRMLETVQVLADRKGQALDFVVVGLDPLQDKPADWAALRALRGLQRSNWHFVAAGEAATRGFARQLGVRYWRYGEHTMHDFKIVLMGPDGQIARSVDRFDADLATLLP